LTRWLSQIGERVQSLGLLLWQLLGFMGQTLATLFRVLPHPGRWRVTPFVAAVQDTGLNALPIVALLTFLVGAVVAFLGATVLQDFGATIYTVNLVAFSVRREFGVLRASLLLAGRPASSFTAHIGAMKVNEELDAIRTLGLNPVELLVLPRVLAMMVSLPILTFVGMIAGMVGGALVCVLSLDISLNQFLAIVERDIALRHFLVGLCKAPVFAFLIAVIGCLEGFKVGGSAQSVGEHTTSSVVQSIFTVILLDAIAALFFMEMGW
ncbi:MAG: ABC transporter permease, partial [Marinobacter sp.]|nr:ABC transporter permease [Marinobacter sp.]